ncbi:uncharacterized protein MYCFIDRAFT_198977 [Pseudocercospora fijiensis CIRAD86]|uniref:Uncharacterized protein n=1 Tax=Pseudocercospora fijiensis (strain CIRAD86) TaxID=383855 RepID=M2ZJ41_PSEFD|nr:uncharacterized protein MYCFIDRAFT_198977 [Pseudocercospora fijiensis CIRAD86]EME79119.1 hypothetical protein MYCFIDRAFT_198977 [Pseudocercospora fijiensis CIRAD86]
MCIVETQTKIFSEGQRESTRIAKRCHRAPVDGICDIVEYKHLSPQDSGIDLPLRDSSKTDTRHRADSTLQDSYRQSREERDAQMLRDQLAKSERKRISAKDDLRPSIDDDTLRESSNERRRRIRRETQAALEGAQEADKRRSQIENDRKLAAEFQQIEKEKLKKKARDSASYTPNPFEPSSPASSSRSMEKNTCEYPTSPIQQRRPLPSARQMTDTTGGAHLSTRTPRYGNVQVHNPPPPPPPLPPARMDPLAERGDRVIQREQMRAVEDETRRMNDMLERTNLRDQMEGDGFDEVLESGSQRYEGGASEVLRSNSN